MRNGLLGEDWEPPQDVAVFVGRSRAAKAITTPLELEHILALVLDIPDARWRFAFQLMAAYGLRPEELQHLQILQGRPSLWKELRWEYEAKGEKLVPCESGHSSGPDRDPSAPGGSADRAVVLDKERTRRRPRQRPPCWRLGSCTRTRSCAPDPVAVRIEAFAPGLQETKDFRCGSNSQDNVLRRTAKRQQRDGCTRLYVATDATRAGEPRACPGFYAIHAHAIGVAEVPFDAAPRAPRSTGDIRARGGADPCCAADGARCAGRCW
jgi:hypothetical protein